MQTPDTNINVQAQPNPRAGEFWRVTNENIFIGTQKPTNLIMQGFQRYIEEKGKYKPGKKIQLRRDPLNFPRIDKLRDLPIQPPAQVSLSQFVTTRRRSIDKLDFRAKDWLDRFVSKKNPKRMGMLFNGQRKADATRSVKSKADNIRLLLGTRFATTFVDLDDCTRKKSVSRQSSMDSALNISKLPITLFKPNRSDYIIALLKSILAPKLARSVFVKDFLVLHRKFYKRPNYQFNYRSRSADNYVGSLSVRKGVLLRSATFPDFLLNMYRHYHWLTKGSQSPLLTNHIFGNMVQSYERGIREPGHGKSYYNKSAFLYKCFKFDFLQCNQDARHFAKMVKAFNKTNRFRPLRSSLLVYKRQRTQQHELTRNVPTSKQITDSKKTRGSFDKNGSLARNRDTSIFLHKLDGSVFERKNNSSTQNEMKAKFSYAVRRTIVMSKRKDLASIHESINNNTRTKAAMSIKPQGKSLMVDINLLYKLPKTLEKDNMARSRLIKQSCEKQKMLSLLSSVDFSKRRSTRV